MLLPQEPAAPPCTLSAQHLTPPTTQTPPAPLPEPYTSLELANLNPPTWADAQTLIGRTILSIFDDPHTHRPQLYYGVITHIQMPTHVDTCPSPRTPITSDAFHFIAHYPADGDQHAWSWHEVVSSLVPVEECASISHPRLSMMISTNEWPAIYRSPSHRAPGLSELLQCAGSSFLSLVLVDGTLKPHLTTILDIQPQFVPSQVDDQDFPDDRLLFYLYHSNTQLLESTTWPIIIRALKLFRAPTPALSFDARTRLAPMALHDLSLTPTLASVKSLLYRQIESTFLVGSGRKKVSVVHSGVFFKLTVAQRLTDLGCTVNNLPPTTLMSPEILGSFFYPHDGETVNEIGWRSILNTIRTNGDSDDPMTPYQYAVLRNAVRNDLPIQHIIKPPYSAPPLVRFSSFIGRPVCRLMWDPAASSVRPIVGRIICSDHVAARNSSEHTVIRDWHTFTILLQDGQRYTFDWHDVLLRMLPDPALSPAALTQYCAVTSPPLPGAAPPHPLHVQPSNHPRLRQSAMRVLFSPPPS